MAQNVTVQIPTALRNQTGDQASIEVNADTVGAVLDSLIETYPQLGQRLFDQQKNLNRFINVYLNDEDIRFLENLETTLKDGDEISIIPAIAGG